MSIKLTTLLKEIEFEDSSIVKDFDPDIVADYWRHIGPTFQSITRSDSSYSIIPVGLLLINLWRLEVSLEKLLEDYKEEGRFGGFDYETTLEMALEEEKYKPRIQVLYDEDYKGIGNLSIKQLAKLVLRILRTNADNIYAGLRRALGQENSDLLTQSIDSYVISLGEDIAHEQLQDEYDREWNSRRLP